MTIEIIDYTTRFLMEQGKTLKNSQGLRPLHTDFINNDELQGFHVTYVNGIDDPENSAEAIAKRAEFARLKTLRAKLENDTISFPELKDLLRSSGVI